MLLCLNRLYFSLASGIVVLCGNLSQYLKFMANVNRVTLIGNLTRDPEVKFTPKGTATATIGLAINRKYKVGEEMKEEVTFVDVELWGRQAEVVGEYCQKGRPLYVEGRLKLDQWDDKASGAKRSKLKVVGENIQLLGGRDSGGEGSGGGSRPPARSAAERPAQRPPAPSSAANFPDDDVPF